VHKVLVALGADVKNLIPSMNNENSLCGAKRSRAD
jgi:hypothetical protein